MSPLVLAFQLILAGSHLERLFRMGTGLLGTEASLLTSLLPVCEASGDAVAPPRDRVTWLRKPRTRCRSPRRAHWRIPMGFHGGACACVDRRAAAVWVQLCCGQRDPGSRSEESAASHAEPEAQTAAVG